MVSQHTAENNDSLTTKQPKGETAIPLTFRGIAIPRQIVEKIHDPPQQSFRRDGSRIVVGKPLSEHSVYKDALRIENPSEYDISHCGY